MYDPQAQASFNLAELLDLMVVVEIGVLLRPIENPHTVSRAITRELLNTWPIKAVSNRKVLVALSTMSHAYNGVKAGTKHLETDYEYCTPQEYDRRRVRSGHRR